jgi:hypothetical protein
MREIKFRAWNKITKQMSKSFTLSQLAIATDVSFQIEYVEFLEYTGLKDKNGKELYEADIVIPFYTVAGYGRKQEVRWGIGAWEPFDGNCDSDHSDRYEVIGNIYENPELLEKNND